MASSMIDYLEHNKNLPPMNVDYPFSEFDAAIFSWMVYFPLSFVPTAPEGDEEDCGQILFYDHCKKIIDSCNGSSSTPPTTSEEKNDSFTLSKYKEPESRSGLAFLKHVMGNPRYKDVKLERSLVGNKTVQLAAVTFVLPYEDENKEIRVITFRGTDGTYVGWKENFYFALKKGKSEVKREAGNYVSKTIEQCPNSKFVITGHSKGGHLAVYSFYKYVELKWFNLMWGSIDGSPDQDLKDKFYVTKKGKSVLNFDGPGIKEEERKDIEGSITNEDFLLEKYEKMVAVYAPSSAIISVLLGRSCKKEEWTYVSSNARGVYQHSLCSWIITDKYDFLKGGMENAFLPGAQNILSEFVEESVKKFLKRYSEDEEQEKFRKFIDIVFFILDDKRTQMITLPGQENLLFYVEKYLSLSEDDKEPFKEVLKSIIVVIEKKKTLIEGEKEHEKIKQYLAMAKVLMIVLDSPGALETIRDFARNRNILNFVKFLATIEKLLNTIPDEEKKTIMSLF